MGSVYAAMVLVIIIVAALVWGLVYLSGDVANEQYDNLD